MVDTCIWHVHPSSVFIYGTILCHTILISDLIGSFFILSGLISDKLILKLCQIWLFILLHQQFALSYGAIIINKLMERIAHLEGLIDLSTVYENKKIVDEELNIKNWDKHPWKVSLFVDNDEFLNVSLQAACFLCNCFDGGVSDGAGVPLTVAGEAFWWLSGRNYR